MNQLIENVQLLAPVFMAVAVAIRGSERRLVRRFRGEEAFSPETAINVGPLNRLMAWQMSRLLSRGVLVEDDTGRHFFSADAYSLFRQARRKRALLIFASLMALGTVLFLARRAPVFAQPSASGMGWTESFDGVWEERWEVRRLAREFTRFDVRSVDGDSVLVASADRSAAVLVRSVDGIDGPVTVSWRWSIARALTSDRDELDRSGDDFAARVFVIFGSDFADSDTPALCYVWARNASQGAAFRSPVAERVQTIVLRNGSDGEAAWRDEMVDPIADYQRVFGDKPPAIGAIGLMSDADDTGSTSVALFDDITVSWAGD